MAIALTTALYMSKHKDELKYNVRFIFQMAEEDTRVPGADKLVELGCMEGVDEVYALHNNGAMDLGSIQIRPGSLTSYCRMWDLNIKGISAHGSTPQNGLDAVREGARILQEMDYTIARKINPLSSAVFTCGIFNGGSVPNAIPDSAYASGTTRALDEETDKILVDSFQTMANESCGRGFKTTFVGHGYPAVVNHPEAYKRIVDSARKTVLAEIIYDHCEPFSGSEDFSYMINATKDKYGAMFFIGSENKEKGICNFPHTNPYYVDDDFLLNGSQVFINLAI